VCVSIRGEEIPVFLSECNVVKVELFHTVIYSVLFVIRLNGLLTEISNTRQCCRDQDIGHYIGHYIGRFLFTNKYNFRVLLLKLNQQVHIK
jgi:hypothetical protein